MARGSAHVPRSAVPAAPTSGSRPIRTPVVASSVDPKRCPILPVAIRMTHWLVRTESRMHPLTHVWGRSLIRRQMLNTPSLAHPPTDAAAVVLADHPCPTLRRSTAGTRFVGQSPIFWVSNVLPHSAASVLLPLGNIARRTSRSCHRPTRWAASHAPSSQRNSSARTTTDGLHGPFSRNPLMVNT